MNFFDSFEQYDHPLYGYVRLPAVHLEAQELKDVGLPSTASNYEFLCTLANKGFDEKVIKDHEIYRARLDRELATVEKLGFVDYFLLVWKLVSRADSKSIARDFGRGSAAGSLIFFLTDITRYCDPVKYELFFERFVSEIRAKKKIVDGITYIDGNLAPDVDMDFEQSRRAEVIEDLKVLYPQRVCKISTHSKLSGKIVMKECGKILGEYDEETMKAVADMLPVIFGLTKDIQDAYEGTKDKDGVEGSPPEPAFKDWCDNNPEIYQVALQLRGIIKNKGTHPSGYVVAYEELQKFLPVEKNKDDDGNEDISSSFDMDIVAMLTNKVDLLGVRCCSVISKILALTGEKIEDINLDSDPIIYDSLQHLQHAHGLFQIEAPTNLKVCQEVQPKNLSELSDILAMARPGALAYVSDYKGNQCAPIHPLFDPILATTRGVCLYQEQCMQLSHAIGFTLDEAEALRRIVAKKKVEQVVEWEAKIKDKIIEKGLPTELGTMLWKILDDSSKYSFNKCLSPDTVVETPQGDKILAEIHAGDMVLAYDVTEGKNHYVEVVGTHASEAELFEVEFEDGRVITCSMKHKFLCEDGKMHPLQTILEQSLQIMCKD